MSNNNTLPIIDQPLIDGVFAVLEKMDVVLDENPLQYGPQRLNMKLAQARQMLTGTERLFSKVSKWLQKYKAAHRAAELNLQLAKNELLANDPETRGGRNQTVQNAIAETKLPEEVAEAHQLSQTIEDLGVLMSVVKAKRSDLRDIQSRIRDQMKLCHEELALGSSWGSKPAPKTAEEKASEKKGRTTLKQLTQILNGVQVEPDPGESDPGESEENEEISEEEENEIDALLNANKSKPSSVASDIDALDPGEDSSKPAQPGVKEERLLDILEGEGGSESEAGEEGESGKSGLDLDDLFEDEEESTKLPGEAGTSTDDDADKVLDELTKPKKSKKDIDIDSILDEFVV